MDFEYHQDRQTYDRAPTGVQAFLAWVMLWLGIDLHWPKAFTPAPSRQAPKPPNGRYERLMRQRGWIPFYHLGAYWFLKEPGQTRGQLNERVLAVSPHGRIAVYQMRKHAKSIKGRTVSKNYDYKDCVQAGQLRQSKSLGLWAAHDWP